MTYNDGKWSSARFRSFITSALRRASSRWGPKYGAKKAARVARNSYKCAACSSIVPNKEAKVDHVHPVVDPVRGFVSWDEFIARLFVSGTAIKYFAKPSTPSKPAKSGK